MQHDWPPAETRARIESVCGEAVVSCLRVQRGYTPAARWQVTLASGARRFVKMATTPFTLRALLAEQRAYQQLQLACMPRVFGWQEHPTEPLLVLEELSAAHWPPPWQPGLMEEVLAVLSQVHAAPAPGLPSFADLHGQLDNGWRRVAEAPEPFLSVGLASQRWLEAALPALVDAADRLDTAGPCATHFDLRSDNLCRTSRGVVLIDWNQACRGNRELDIGFWLPSLRHEGGPAPEQVLPHHPEVAAFVSGYFADNAGRPPIADAPRVRLVQRAQLTHALPWAARALGLPPPV